MCRSVGPALPQGRSAGHFARLGGRIGLEEPGEPRLEDRPEHVGNGTRLLKQGVDPYAGFDVKGKWLLVNAPGLLALGNNLLAETTASGSPLTGTPGLDGFGTILQGFLEASNVDPVKELVTLIKTQRAFELNSQSIQTADQALQTVSNLRRF